MYDKIPEAAGFNPRFGRPGVSAQDQQTASQSSASSHATQPTSPMLDALSFHSRRLMELRSMILELSSRLSPVTFPATPDENGASTQCGSASPLIAAIEQQTTTVDEMQVIVTSLLARLAI